MLESIVKDLHKRLADNKHTKILFFGSSNTARIDVGLHWSDCLDFGIDQKFGRIHRSLNMGVGGDTTRNLLERFDRDVAAYTPDLVILTIGGNDSSPTQNLSEQEFYDNLMLLHKKTSALGAQLVFQTYYAPIAGEMDDEHLVVFNRYMQVVRDVAQETKSGLHDPLVRWEALQEKYRKRYLYHMRDCLHLNHFGNEVFGLDLARSFGCEMPDNDYWERAKTVQALMDTCVQHKNK